MIWTGLKLFWHGEDNIEGGSERYMYKGEEDRSRDGNTTLKTGHGSGVKSFHEGGGRRGNVESYFCTRRPSRLRELT